MVKFYVLSSTLVKIGFFENYNSIQWQEDYNGSGRVEIHANPTEQNKDLLKIGNIIQNGTSVADISSVQINKTEIIALGKMAGERLNKRVVLQTERIEDVETDLRTLFTNQNRGTGLALGASAGLTEEVASQVTGGTVLEAFTAICGASGLGWKVDNTLALTFYKGKDRRIGQPDCAGVLSDFSDTIEKIVLSGDISRAYNVAVVAGAGEGAARVWTTAWLAEVEPTGIERRELWVDARDLTKTYMIEGDPVEKTYSDADYLEILKARGREKLAKALFESKFSADVIDGNLTFGGNYNLGDIMPIKLVEYGVSFSARVVSATRIYEQGEKTLIKVEKI